MIYVYVIFGLWCCLGYLLLAAMFAARQRTHPWAKELHAFDSFMLSLVFLVFSPIWILPVIADVLLFSNNIISTKRLKNIVRENVQ